MSWDNELAREFTKRNNKNPMGAVCGTVITVDPLKVSILGGSVFLSGDMIRVCSNLINNATRKATIKLDSVADHGSITTDGTITYNEILKEKDQVLCLPADGGQTFFIIDKAV